MVPLLLLLPFFVYLVAQTNAQTCFDDFSWSSITPSAQLNWTSCYTSVASIYQCARLEVGAPVVLGDRPI
ncbi:unnamed protein product [Peniophora sp. CBMAI 1063]|nr:unnamed protein product [Peniophora sp. CBMAI 1063]